jgi:hypothetical protein
MIAREDKVYALFLETKGMTFLSVQLAVSLEEAFSLAKMEFVRTSNAMGEPKRGRGIAGAKIGLFTIKAIDDLMEETEEFRQAYGEAKDIIRGRKNDKIVSEAMKRISTPMAKAVEPTVDKNKLMKEIIETKDKGLYELNRSKFSKQEQAYIRAQLKK